MPNQDLKIMISATLNSGQAIKDLNLAIQSLSKSPRLQKLQVKIDADQKFVQTMSGFIAATQKLSKNLDDQNKVVRETQNVHRQLDGTVSTITQKFLKNGEIIEKTRTIHNENKKAMQDESQAALKLANNIEHVNKAEMDSIKVNRNRANAITGYNIKSSKGYTVTNQNLEADGKTLINSSTLTNYKKEKEDIERLDRDHFNALKINSKRIEDMDRLHYLALKKNRDLDIANKLKTDKEAESLDRAHYNALKTDKSKIEALDRLHYLALKRNRELDVSNKLKADKEAEMIDRAHYNALRTNNARIEAQDKQHYLALQQNAKRDLDYKQSILAQQNKINDAMRRYSGDPNLVANLNRLRASLGNVKNIGDFKSQLRDIDNGLKRITAGASTAASHTLKFGEAMKTAFQKFPIWMIATTAFYAPLRALQNGIRSIYEIDTAMTDLQKVTDATDDQYKDFLETSNDVATSLGALTVDVIKATTEWARLGYNIQQASMLAKETTIYANVGDMDASQASLDLISAIKGFGIEVDKEGKKIRNVVDIYNEVGNRFAISSAGIGDALRRSSSSLAAAGNTIEESVALVTAANSTLQNPTSVGTALKTVSMRIRGISEDGEELGDLVPSLEKKFNSLGLSLKKDDNSFKSTYEIFNDLSTIWNDGLSDFEKADITELIAGKRQGNVITSLLDNWTDAEAALQVALNSTGSAAKENETYLNSLKAKVAQFHNTVTGFWESGESAEILKTYVSVGTTLVEVLAKIADKFGGMNTAIGLVTTALITFTAAGRSMTAAFVNVIPFASALNQKIALMSTALNRFPKTVTAAGVSLKALRLNLIAARIGAVALQTTMSLGLSFAITAIISGITSLIGKMKESSKAVEEMVQSSTNTISSLKEQKKAINDLSDEMSVLQENVAAHIASEEDKKRLLDIQNELVTSYNVTSTGIDNESKSLTTNTEQIKKRTKALEDQISAENKNRLILLRSQDENNLKTISDSSNDIESYATEQAILDDRIKKLTELQSEGKKLVKNNFIGNKELINEASPAISDVNIDHALATLGKRFAELGKKIKSSSTAMNDALSVRSHVLTSSIEEYIRDLKNSGKSVSKEEENFINQFIEPISKSGVKIDPAIKELQTIFDKLRSSNFEELLNQFKIADADKNSKEMDNIRLSVVRLLETLTEGMNIPEGFSEAILSMFSDSDKIVSTLDDTTIKMDEFSDATKETTTSLGKLSSAYDTLHEGESLSVDTLLELIHNHPKLAEYLANEKDLTFDKGEILKQVAEIERQTRLEEAQHALDAVEQTRKELEDKQKLYAEFYENMVKAGAPDFALDSVTKSMDLTDEEKAKLIEVQKNRNELLAEIKILKQPLKFFSSSSDSKDKSDKDKDLAELADTTEAFINKTNEAALAQKNLNDEISQRVSDLQSQERYADAINKTNVLLASQKKEINAINVANTTLKVKMNDLQKDNPHYKMSKWIDANGEATQEYLKLYNNQATGTAQKKLQELFDKWKALSGAVSANKNELKDLQKQIVDTTKSYYDLVTTSITSTADRTTGKIDRQVSLLGEVNTEDEKKKIAEYGQGILDALNKEKSDIWKAIQEIKNTLSDPKVSQDIKDALEDTLNNLEGLNNDTNVKVIQQAEQLGKDQAEALSIGFNNQIDDLNYQKSLLGNIDTDEEKKKAQEINNEIKNVLLKGKEVLDNQITELERKLSENLTEEERRRVQSKLEILQNYSKDFMSQLIQINEDEVSARQENADTIIENYKKLLEQEKQMALDSIDAQIDAENKRHDERTKHLDDEMKQQEDSINAQLDALDKLNAEQDYQDELTAKTKERKEIQDQLNVLSLDNSFEAKAKRADLQKQLADKDEEIAKFQQDRGREIVKEGLGDQLDDYKTHNDKLKDIEDKKNTDALNNLDEEKKAQEQYYDDRINDEENFYSIKQNLLSNDTVVVKNQLDTLRTEYNKFYSDVAASASLYGQKAADNLNYSFGQDEKELDKYGESNSKTSNNFPSDNTPSDNSSKMDEKKQTDWHLYLDNKKLAEGYAKQISGSSKEDADKLRKKIADLKAVNDIYRSKYNFPDKSYDELKNIDIASLDTGGYTGQWGPQGKFGILHEKELVLDKVDTSSLFKTVDIAKGIIDKARNFNFNNLFTKSSSPNNNNTGTTIENLYVTISGKFAQKNGDDVFDSLIGGMKAKGIRI